MAKRKTRADIKIRMNANLRSKIEQAALQNDVSMNTEMTRRLEKSFRRAPAKTRANLEDAIAEFQRMTHQLATDIYLALQDIPCVKSAVDTQMAELKKATA